MYPARKPGCLGAYLPTGRAIRLDYLVAQRATDLSDWMYALRKIIQANIDRFMNLLKTETDPTRRAMETRLLADEEAKLKQLPPKKSDEKKAY